MGHNNYDPVDDDFINDHDDADNNEALMTMMIHQLSVTSNKVSSQLISPQNWPVFIFPLTQSEPDIYHLNSNQSLKKFPVVLTCTYFSFYLSCGPRGIFYYLESIT